MLESRHFCDLSLHIWGDSLDPFSVTDFVGIEPTESFTVGDDVDLPSGSRAKKKTGMWILREKSEDNIAKFQDKFESFLSRFDAVESAFTSLPGVSGAFLACNVGHNLRCFSEELYLSSSQVQRLGDLGLGLRITYVGW
jgi:hypothetical protein